MKSKAMAFILDMLDSWGVCVDDREWAQVITELEWYDCTERIVGGLDL
jgi:hypothetical protein